jgi:hypothetical protein
MIVAAVRRRARSHLGSTPVFVIQEDGVPVTRPSLYEFAGGDAALLALTRAHRQRCIHDPDLNHPFSHPGRHPQHVEQLAAY